MSLKNLIKLLLFATCLIVFSETFARAGGGHGGGGSRGGGGYSGSYHGYSTYSGRSKRIDIYGMFMAILVVAILLLAAIIPALLKLKSNTAAKILIRAANKDSFWETEKLKKHTEKIFLKMQLAWESRNVERVKKEITPELYANYKVVLNKMIDDREKNIITRITISQITIIGCEDFSDNSKDRYVAYIKGTMLDYTINERNNEIIQNPACIIGPFSDTYHFIRHNNAWLLEEIDNRVSALDLIKIKNSIQA